MKWHRYNNKGIKFVINTEIDKHPEPMQQEGYTEWKRGMGAITVTPTSTNKKRKPKKR